MKNPFDKIRLTQLHVLCNTLVQSQVRHVSNIKRKYLESALNFEETVALLQNLKLVRINSDELFLSGALAPACDSVDDFKRAFLPILFSANRQVAGLLRDFLLNFQVEENRIFFRAGEWQKLKYSDTRNLLLELEFISASQDSNTYFVNPVYDDLFFKQFSAYKISPEIMKRKQVDNDMIGLSAELAVVEYECKRLTDISFERKEIEHTSTEDSGAGYDIKSFENYLDGRSKRIDRYIEVKAVSVQDFKFYWSRNEMDIAQVFGNKYYLYLLPVISSNNFDFERLLVVKNPFKNVYQNQIDWDRREESVCISKKP